MEVKRRQLDSESLAMILHQYECEDMLGAHESRYCIILAHEWDVKDLERDLVRMMPGQQKLNLESFEFHGHPVRIVIDPTANHMEWQMTIGKHFN